MSENEIRNENKKSDEFDYSYSSPNSEEKRWIESIRREYLPQDEQDAKLAEIKKLHKKAKKNPIVFATCVGIAGTLILGLGMTLTLEWDNMIAGSIVGVLGMVIMFLTYPFYQYMKTRGKNKYGDRIVKLADEIAKLIGKNDKSGDCDKREENSESDGSLKEESEK